MTSLKKFFLNLFFSFIILYSFSQDNNISINNIQNISSDNTQDVTQDIPRRIIEYYRSNSNGLALVQIPKSETKKHKFFLYQELFDKKLIKRQLFKDNKESKRWEYEYNDNILNKEVYFKDGEIKEEYRYDKKSLKIKQIDYLNGKLFRTTLFTYNSDNLIDKEDITNNLTNGKTFVKYRYDSKFRIKQIEKIYPDKRVVYWESFFSEKGVIIKEYYTLHDEMFVFYYNENGQELNGEVRQILKDGSSKIKIEWSITYNSKGKREKKDETNYLIGKRIITFYNKDGKESKVEIYYNGELATLEEYEYEDKENGKLIHYKKIEDMNMEEIFYKYEEDEIVEEKIVENKKTKKLILRKKDGSYSEIIYTERGTYTINYSKDGKIIF